MTTNARLRIVLDTNILVSSIGRKSPTRWVFDALLEERFALLVSEGILHEYRVVISRKTRPDIADNVVQALTFLPSCERHTPSFRWQLISADPDDNKFVDTALAGGADALVTHDAHFDVIKDIDFPPLSLWDVRRLHEELHP